MSRNAMKKTRRSDDGHLEPAEIGVSEFKQRCLQILDELGPEGIVVTKRGKPVARVLPAIEGHGAFIGVLRGRPIKVREDDDLFSTGAWVSDEWAISRHVAEAIGSLDFRSDPADEIIAATSIAHDVPLLTRDARILASKTVPFAISG